jgi:hypothetical protein
MLEVEGDPLLIDKQFTDELQSLPRKWGNREGRVQSQGQQSIWARVEALIRLFAPKFKPRFCSNSLSSPYPVYNGATRIRSKKDKRARRKPPTCLQWRRTVRSFANSLHQTKKRQGVVRHQTDLLVRIMESIILLQYNPSSKFYSPD